MIKPIKNYEGVYKITKEGVVISLPRKGAYSQEKSIKAFVGKKGYSGVLLCKDGRTSRKLIHRLLAEAFLSNPENKPCVNHKDGNKLNNSLDNLEWVTHGENSRHAYKLGLLKNQGRHLLAYQKSGARKHLRKYSMTFVKKVRELYTKGFAPLAITSKLGVPSGGLNNIIYNKKYYAID